MKVVGYARVSTSEQGESGAGLAAQRLAITVEAERRGWELILIVEDVASGRTMRGRDGLAEAVRLIEAGEADGLLVSKLDQLSRSVADFATMLARFQAKGWGLTLLDIGLDTTTVTGAAMAHVVSAFSEMERKRIGERTREALAERRAAEFSSDGPARCPTPCGIASARCARAGTASPGSPTRSRMTGRLPPTAAVAGTPRPSRRSSTATA